MKKNNATGIWSDWKNSNIARAILAASLVIGGLIVALTIAFPYDSSPASAQTPFMFYQTEQPSCSGSCDSCTDAAAGCVGRSVTDYTNNGDGTCTESFTCESTTYQGAASGAVSCNGYGQLICQYGGFCQHNESGGGGSVTFNCESSGDGGETPTNPIIPTTPPPDFSVTSNPQWANVAAGESFQYTVTVTPSNSFTGTVNLSANCPGIDVACPLGYTCPQTPVATCSWSANSVSVTDTSSKSVTYTVTTTATTPMQQYPIAFKGTTYQPSYMERTSTSYLSVNNGFNNAQCVSAAVNGPVYAGRQFPVTVTMRNTGTRTWRPSTLHNLGSLDSSVAPWTTAWGPGRWGLPNDVPPNTNVTLNINVTAPNTVGTYSNFGFKMVQDGVEWFGAACSQPITVTIPVPTNATASCDASGTNATFTWVAPAGYANFAPRICDKTANPTCNPALPGFWRNDNLAATSWTVTGLTPGNTYGAWVHTVGSPEAASAPDFICPQTASCGSAAKTYASSVTSFGSDTFCGVGALQGGAPAFPNEGEGSTWACVTPGSSRSCYAYRNEPAVAQGFTLSADPTLIRGKKTGITGTFSRSKSTEIRVVPYGGFTGQVTLTASMIVGAAEPVIIPMKVNSPGYTASLFANIPGKAPNGTFEIIVTGTSGNKTATTSVWLDISDGLGGHY